MEEIGEEAVELGGEVDVQPKEGEGEVIEEVVEEVIEESEEVVE